MDKYDTVTGTHVRFRLGMLVAHIPAFQYKGRSLTMARSRQGHS